MAAALDGSTLDPKWPVCPALGKMPTTPKDLFLALGGTVEDGRYGWPWAGYKSWRDASERLSHFRSCNVTAWTDFNDSAGNEGIMTAAGHADKALVENLMNGLDAKIERLAAQYLEANKGKTSISMPSSPFEAVAMWSNGFTPDKLPDMKDQEIEDLAADSLLVRLFADPRTTSKTRGEDPRCVVDIRDYGCGITPEAMVKTILSLNRSGPTSKKNKPWVSGKHGQGAGGTYQYSQLSLIATRVWGSNVVAFTVVTRQWDDATVKTPTFKYLTVGGKVLTFEVSNDAEFPPGLLMRHIGYKGESLVNKGGMDSLATFIQRALPMPLYPVRFEHHIMQPSTHESRSYGPGYSWNRNIYGAVNQATRATNRTASPDPNRSRKAQEFKPTYSTQEIIRLGDYDFGGMGEHGMTGIGPAGYVTMTAWAIDPRIYNEKGEHVDNETPDNVLKMYVNPAKPILFTLDGQTHDEEYRHYLTSESKAGLWRIGQYMFVHLDCNGLTRDGRYELFSSLRETTKKTLLQARIMEAVVRVLKNTPKWQELQNELAVAVKNDEHRDEDFAKAFKDHCSRTDIPLDHLTVRKVGYREIWEKQLGKPEKKVRGKPVPIDPKEPPTLLRWAFNGVLPVKMYPGQYYSWTLLTDAHPDYWTPRDPAHSKIRVTTVGIEVGGGDTKIDGGRILCRFRCPEDADVGSDRLILATCVSAGLHHELPVRVVARPESPKPPGGKPKPLVRGTADKKSKDYVMVRVRRKGEIVDKMPIIRPVAVTRKDPPGQWTMLGWGDPDESGLSVRAEPDGVRVYYNAELPNFLKFEDMFAKDGASDKFRQSYEFKLVLYAIFHLDNEVVFETAVDEDRKPELRVLFTSVADDIVYEAMRETTIEIKGVKDQLKGVSG